MIQFSDTTIYAPALKLTPPEVSVVSQLNEHRPNVPVANRGREVTKTPTMHSEEIENNLLGTEVVNKIDKF